MTDDRNPILSMFADEKERLQRVAQDISDREVAIQEAAREWRGIADLAQSEAFQSLIAMAKAEIDRLKASFETPKDAYEIARIQGQIATLKWFSHIPSLAQIQLISIGQANEALSADKDEFIRTGA